jgi:hypothetical protein
MAFITEFEKIYPKVHLETKESTNSQGNSKQKKQCWSYYNIDFKLYSTAIAIITAWYWHRNIYEDQLNRTEYRDMNPHNSPTLLLTKAPKI